MTNTVKIRNISIANNLPFVLIAGPCQIESADHAMRTAETIAKVCEANSIKFIYKSV